METVRAPFRASMKPLGKDLIADFVVLLREWRGLSDDDWAQVSAPRTSAPLDRFHAQLARAGAKPFGTQDRLLEPGETFIEDGLLVFLVEQQETFRCALDVRAQTVYVSMVGGPWQACAGTPEEFLVTFGLRELIFGSPYWATLSRLPEAQGWGVLLGPTSYVLEECIFYRGEGILALVAEPRSEGEPLVMVGSRDRACIATLRDDVNDWNID